MSTETASSGIISSSAAPATVVKEKVSLVIYAINEIEGMKAVMPHVNRDWVDEILLMDGGSTDGTAEYAASLGCKVHRQVQPTWEGAYKEAFENTIGDIIVDFSPDGNSPPEAIPQLIAKMREGYDMVIASRYLKGAHSEDDTWLTRFGNHLFTGLINWVFRGKFTDTLVIYRAYRRNALRDSGLDVKPNHQFTAQICIRFAKLGKKCADIPVDEPPRIGGESKLRPFYNGTLLLKLIFLEAIRRK